MSDTEAAGFLLLSAGLSSIPAAFGRDGALASAATLVPGVALFCLHLWLNRGR